MTQTQSDLVRPQSVDFVQGRGLMPRNLDELWRVAQAAARSGLVPKGVDTPEKCFIAMQLGAELGLSPLQAVQGIAVINGRPAVWGDTLLAVCQRATVFDHAAFKEWIEGEGEARVAVCQCRRTSSPNLVEKRFSVADAKKARLWGKSGPWETNPDRMLQMRARAFALRDTFADLLKGYYTAEEASDLPPRQVEVVVTEPKPAAPTSRSAQLAASAAAPAGPPPSLVEQAKSAMAHAVEPVDELDAPPADIADDEVVRETLTLGVQSLKARVPKAALSRLGKSFGLLTWDADELARLSVDDLTGLRDALNGEQTEAK